MTRTKLEASKIHHNRQTFSYNSSSSNSDGTLISNATRITAADGSSFMRVTQTTTKKEMEVHYPIDMARGFRNSTNLMTSAHPYSPLASRMVPMNSKMQRSPSQREYTPTFGGDENRLMTPLNNTPSPALIRGRAIRNANQPGPSNYPSSVTIEEVPADLNDEAGYISGPDAAASPPMDYDMQLIQSGIRPSFAEARDESMSPSPRARAPRFRRDPSASPPPSYRGRSESPVVRHRHRHRHERRGREDRYRHRSESVEYIHRKKMKARKHRPGVKALQDIRKYQKSTNLLIPKTSFQRVIREIALDVTGDRDFRFQLAALLALQEASEAFLIQVFSDSVIAAAHGKRVTVMPKDINLVRYLQHW